MKLTNEYKISEWGYDQCLKNDTKQIINKHRKVLRK